LRNLIGSAKLLVTGEALTTRRDGDDMLVKLPAKAPDEVVSVVALKLDGKPNVVPYFLRPDGDGVVTAGVESSEIETRFEQRAKKENFLGHVYLTNWTRADDVPSWNLSVPKGGRYRVEVSYAAGKESAGSDFAIAVGQSNLAAKVRDHGGDNIFKAESVGEMALPQGEQTLRVKSNAKDGVNLMQLERIRLVPLK
jgi:hypothetical protein